MNAHAPEMRVFDSPNQGARPEGAAPRLIVLHYTAMTGGSGPVIDFLCDTRSQVSAHYVIGERGPLARLVPEHRRAWHAGVGNWGGCGDVNSISIGIELSNDGASPFSAPQMDRLEWLLGDLMARYDIPPEGVIGHSDCAPRRKIDPGPRFDWRRLARRGLSVWPAGGEAPVDAGAFVRDARRAGWTMEVDLPDLVHSLRLRFRPWATGPLDGRDCAIAADMARRFPVDRPLLTA